MKVSLLGWKPWVFVAMFGFLVAMPVRAQQCESVYSYSVDFKAPDGTSYTKSYFIDDCKWTSVEVLYKTAANGSLQFVASLSTDPEGNWTGVTPLGNYEDKWMDEPVYDWVVMVGADIWPTWWDFDAYLSSLNFWSDWYFFDGGISILPVFDLGGAVYLMSSANAASSGGATIPVYKLYGTCLAIVKAASGASSNALAALSKVLSHCPTPPAHLGQGKPSDGPQKISGSAAGMLFSTALDAAVVSVPTLTVGTAK